MIELNRNSWHFKMAQRGGHRYYAEMSGLCDYAIKVLKGMLKYSGVVALLTYLAVGTIMQLIYFYQFGTLHESPEGSGFMGWWFAAGYLTLVSAIAIPASLLILYVFFHTVGYVCAITKHGIIVSKRVPFVATVYRGFKDKYCPTVSFKD